MDILLNERKRKLFTEIFYFKDTDENVMYTAKTSLLTCNNVIKIYKGDKLVAKVSKQIFEISLPKYKVKTIEKEKFFLTRIPNFSYKINNKPWYIDGNMKFFYNKIITLTSVPVAELYEDPGVQPNYRIKVEYEKDIIPLLCVIMCIYFSKKALAKKMG